jgi:hypothetical protein
MAWPYSKILEATTKASKGKPQFISKERQCERKSDSIRMGTPYGYRIKYFNTVFPFHLQWPIIVGDLAVIAGLD